MNAISAPAPNATVPPRKPWYRILYIQVLLGVFLGILTGYFFPESGKALKPLGDGFIKLVKMIIAPIIFCTVVHGVASMGDLKRLGRIGVKALVYFEVVSTIALLIGLLVVNVWKPGAGFNIDVTKLDASVGQGYAEKASHAASTTDFFLNMIPRSYFDAFASGDLLQVLLVATLTAFAVAALGEKGRPILRALAHGEKIFFGIMHIIVKVAPLAAFGAMAYTVGSHGIGSLQKLFSLMMAFYTTAIVFVIVVLGSIAWWCGFSIFRFIAFIKEELLLVLGTSSSETALPGMMEKMRRLGCAESTVGFVIPTGYSFNLDGTNIYMTMAAIFLAQATNTPLSVGQQISLLLVAMISSKGASGVTGAGFITLAATLSAVPTVPMASLALLVGIDRFMSECRALTNLVGNGVATVAISRWENEVTGEQLKAVLLHKREANAAPLGENGDGAAKGSGSSTEGV
ncbi:aerobic C4-dicarboxylate transport protein [Roseimicrobium gellanilyticum]|uniref:Aerobic C4-dicarboxylate transport protein n=1 Tax=Roseimicrobium gellanilyticum TaxID=748857 RepID=A0A366HNI9_9BACT|nr:dicarboxylate/amino acid:cation symporter [Roseimicrobium gellanilyticum]RBP45057.1 aerobic C4-dicarboxylate transport protein [Roseimicrobium gellanilyticum]